MTTQLELQLDEGPKILDFLTSGNVLGEIGVLTNKRRTATVKSETAVLVGLPSHYPTSNLESVLVDYDDDDVDDRNNDAALACVCVCVVVVSG